MVRATVITSGGKSTKVMTPVNTAGQCSTVWGRR